MARRRFFQIRNWERFQHYKKRSPPWIKNYTDLLFNLEYLDLSDAARGHVHGIWLLAAKLNNRLPWDPKWLQERLGLDSEPDLSELQRLEFIEPWCKQVASKVLVSVETETETETEESLCTPNGVHVAEASEPASSDPLPAPCQCPHQKLVELYHQHCPTLPRVKVLTERRQQFARQRWREVLDGRAPREALEWFGKFFERVNQSEFLTGQVANGQRRAFVADFEWLMRPSNFVKVHEGRYDG